MKQFLCLFLLIPVLTCAQKGGEIKFWVIDQITGDTLKNAQAIIIHPDSLDGKPISCNETGLFKLRPIAAGFYTISISAPGYETQVIRGILVSELKTTYLNPRLKPLKNPVADKQKSRRRKKRSASS